jgi:hypothetical protein
MRTISLFILGTALAAPYSRSQAVTIAIGKIYGSVVTTDHNGNQINVQHATITLLGPSQRKAFSDGRGSYSFENLPKGFYLVSANAPGLAGSTQVQLNSAIAFVDVRLHVNAIVNTVTVSAAGDPSSASTSAQNVTISSSVVQNDNLLPLVPGVVRGPDGRLNLKGASSSQAGWLVNSSNVTDPATGEKAMTLPIDIVSSVKVLSNPYDPEYGLFTGAVSSVETRTGNFTKLHMSVQNLLPRPRRRGGHFVGIGAATPRLTVTGPLLKGKSALTESLEYRFVRTPVESLPPLRCDTTVEGVDSFSQMDMNLGERQTATASLAFFPQRIEYLGLNTFTPQLSTPTLHQRGYQASFQHRLITSPDGLLLSQASLERYDANILPNSSAPYRLGVESAEGGFFNTHQRRDSRIEFREAYQSGIRNFYGSHRLKIGAELSRSTYQGHQTFRPVEILGADEMPVERITFGPSTAISITQDEIAWYGGDQWKPWNRLTLDLGFRFDADTVTGAIHPAPRAGFTLALDESGKTLLRAGGGLFYDRVPLNAPAFPYVPSRTIEALSLRGQVVSAIPYSNVIVGHLRNPRSDVWNAEIDRDVLPHLMLRFAYQQRHTSSALVVAPFHSHNSGELELTSSGREIYREFQVTGTYRVHGSTVNASYVRSRTAGDLNDLEKFFGNEPQAVIQPDQSGTSDFDAPNRTLAWGDIEAPWKVTIIPVLDIHTGFPYSVDGQDRQFVGVRNSRRLPMFASADLQVLRQITLPLSESHKAKIGLGIFNVFDHFNPRDVQNDVDSYRFGSLFNSPPTTFRGKFVLEF